MGGSPSHCTAVTVASDSWSQEVDTEADEHRSNADIDADLKRPAWVSSEKGSDRIDDTKSWHKVSSECSTALASGSDLSTEDTELVMVAVIASEGVSLVESLFSDETSSLGTSSDHGTELPESDGKESFGVDWDLLNPHIQDEMSFKGSAPWNELSRRQELLVDMNDTEDGIGGPMWVPKRRKEDCYMPHDAPGCICRRCQPSQVHFESRTRGLHTRGCRRVPPDERDLGTTGRGTALQQSGVLQEKAADAAVGTAKARPLLGVRAAPGRIFGQRWGEALLSKNHEEMVRWFFS